MTQNINLDISSEVKDAEFSEVEAAVRALISVDFCVAVKGSCRLYCCANLTLPLFPLCCRLVLMQSL